MSLDNENGYKVVRVRVQDFTRLRVVDVEPPPDTVQVGGKNGQGKTSLTDAIIAAIGGKRHCPPRPIRLGADRAEILVDVGDFEVLRVFDGERTTVRVRSKDGAEYRSPQKRLDAMLGPCFDPFGFTQLRPNEQRNLLLEILDLGDFDLEASEDRERAAREDRRDMNRDLKKVEAERDGIGLPANLSPEAPDVSARVAALEAAVKAEADYQARVSDGIRIRQAANEAEAARGDVAKRAEDRIVAARKALEAAEQQAVEEVAQAEAKAKALDQEAKDIAAALEREEPIDIEGARAAVDEAREYESQVRQRERWRELDKRAECMEKDIKTLEAKIDVESDERSKVLASAGIPVEGLTVAEEGLEYRGVPFSQASQAEQIQVAVALLMAKKPRLRFLRVKDASLLDEEHLTLVQDLARNHGCQLWLETVDRDGADLVIEDGQIVT